MEDRRATTLTDVSKSEVMDVMRGSRRRVASAPENPQRERMKSSTAPDPGWTTSLQEHWREFCVKHRDWRGEGKVQNLPKFKVLKRAEQPPEAGYHILLVHRFSADKRSLVHDISGRLPGSEREVGYMTGPEAFTGT